MNREYVTFADGWYKLDRGHWGQWSSGKNILNVQDVKILSLTFEKPSNSPATKITIHKKDETITCPIKNGLNTIYIYCEHDTQLTLEMDTFVPVEIDKGHWDNRTLGLFLKKVEILPTDSNVFTNLDLGIIGDLSGHECIYKRVDKSVQIEKKEFVPSNNKKTKVVMCVPCGRKRNLEILLPYILRDRDVIDEVQLWVNTNNEEDLNYINMMELRYPTFFKCIRLSDNNNWNACGDTIGPRVSKFYTHCTDVNTIYIKCDDDICFIEEGTIKELISFRLNNPKPLLIYPNIINNAIMSYLHQRAEVLTTNVGICGWTSGDKIGWNSGEFAAEVHETFIKNYNNNSLDVYKFPKWSLLDYPKASIGFIVFFGEDLASFNGVIEFDEEFLAVILPERLNRPNKIFGKKIVSHYSFCSQKEYLDKNHNFLSEYKNIMEMEIAKHKKIETSIKMGMGWYYKEFNENQNRHYVWSSDESWIHILSDDVLCIDMDIYVSGHTANQIISVNTNNDISMEYKLSEGYNNIRIACKDVTDICIKSNTFIPSLVDTNSGDSRKLGIQLSKIIAFSMNKSKEFDIQNIKHITDFAVDMDTIKWNPNSLLKSDSIFKEIDNSIKQIDLPNTDRVSYFNSCIFGNDNQIFLCARRDESSVDRLKGRDSFNFEDVKSNSLSIFKLNDDYQPIDEIRLNIPPEFETEQLEDPRVLVGEGKILILCSSRKLENAICQIKILVFDTKFNYISTIHPIYDGNTNDINTNTKIHKNWTWFWYDGKLHAIVHLNPFTVVEFDLTGKAVKEYIHKDFDFSWEYGNCSGGTNPIMYLGKYKAEFHSREMTGTHYVIYHWGNYEFEPIPPFKPIQYTKTPILSGNEKDSDVLERRWVIFPMGSITRNGKLITSFGLNDRYTYIMENLI